MADLAVSVAPDSAPAERAATMAFATMSGVMATAAIVPQAIEEPGEIIAMPSAFPSAKHQTSTHHHRWPTHSVVLHDPLPTNPTLIPCSTTQPPVTMPGHLVRVACTLAQSRFSISAGSPITSSRRAKGVNPHTLFGGSVTPVLCRSGQLALSPCGRSCSRPRVCLKVIDEGE
jgi:hypothetical protein